MRNFVRMMLLCCLAFFAMSASADFLGGVLKSVTGPSAEEVSAAENAEFAKHKDERMNDPLVIQAARCGYAPFIIDKRYLNDRYPPDGEEPKPNELYSDEYVVKFIFKFNREREYPAGCLDNNLAAIPKRLDELYVSRNVGLLGGVTFKVRVGGWEAEKSAIVARVENEEKLAQEKKMAAIPKIANEAVRRKNSSLLKLFGCNVDVENIGSYGWSSEGFITSRQIQCDSQSEDNPQLVSLLKSTYFPFLSSLKELPRDKADALVKAGLEILAADKQYFEKSIKEAKAAESTKRTQLLKSGKLPIASFDDAILFYSPPKSGIADTFVFRSPGNIFDIVRQTPLAADNSVVMSNNLAITILSKESDGLLKVDYAAFVKAYTDPLNQKPFIGSYNAYLRIDANLVQHGGGRLALETPIRFIGKYVDNKKYWSVMRDGVEKMGPVIQVLHYTLE